MLCLLSGWTKRNKPRVLNGWAVKRYSAPILPYLAEKLTEQGFITFLQRLTHALRHKITHIHTSAGRRAVVCMHRLLASVWADLFAAFKRFHFQVCNCLILTGKQIGTHQLECRHYATIWSACCKLIENGCCSIKGFCDNSRTWTKVVCVWQIYSSCLHRTLMEG